jgi:hypothetical protein
MVMTDGACGTYGVLVKKKVAEALDYLEDVGVDAMVTFKCILRT